MSDKVRTDSKIKVLIVEDSIVCAEIIKHILESDKEIKVVGIARNGKEAIELVEILKPDLITMDIHMPEMNGLEATEYIMAYHPTPIIVVSSSIHERDTELAFQAIAAGALDVLEKPDPNIWESFAEVGNELINKVKFLSGIKVITHVRGKKKFKAKQRVSKETVDGMRIPGSPAPEASGVVLIGASTGGPQALAKVIAPLPSNFNFPVVVGQHIAEGFLNGFVSWLDSISRVRVKVAEHGESLEPGRVYVSPVEKHVSIVEPGMVELIPATNEDTYRPSINTLFASAASVFRMNTVTVLLTGMGSDGAKGMKRVYDLGGYTIAQDEKTSVVFGMPRAAIELGAVREVLSIDEIADRVIEITRDLQKISEKMNLSAD